MLEVYDRHFKLTALPDDASLVHDLPGTGSKIVAYGVSDITKAGCFRAASQPIADKSALTKALFSELIRTCV
ncbi:hypothetical protein KUIN1_49170 [Pseudomonas sp. KUIN-1]|nr:hypothetical protein KUIN1_49170 [Pseudomonas sp. KUIN-1]